MSVPTSFQRYCNSYAKILNKNKFIKLKCPSCKEKIKLNDYSTHVKKSHNFDNKNYCIWCFNLYKTMNIVEKALHVFECSQVVIKNKKLNNHSEIIAKPLHKNVLRLKGNQSSVKPLHKNVLRLKDTKSSAANNTNNHHLSQKLLDLKHLNKTTLKFLLSFPTLDGSNIDRYVESTSINIGRELIIPSTPDESKTRLDLFNIILMKLDEPFNLYRSTTYYN